MIDQPVNVGAAPSLLFSSALPPRQRYSSCRSPESEGGGVS